MKDPALARAFRSHRPVEGKVVQVIKGGYEVRVGRTRAFCPHSQIDLHRTDDPEAYVGRTLFFHVNQFRRGGEDVVLSRRAVLEEEQAEEASAVRATLIEGSVMQGHVSGIADFGAFVDLGAGVQGLVHISELSHTRQKRVSDVVKVGDTVRVKILKLEDGRGRISLSLRLAEKDPWENTGQDFQVGQAYPGTVRRLADFGAFVEMRPGVEALAPAREFPPSVAGWNEGLEPGTESKWLVLSVDPDQRRMSVVPAGDDPGAFASAIEEGGETRGKVQKIERFGVFVWLGPGNVGLMPTVWSGVPQGTRLDARYKIGQDVDVRVVEISDGGRRIRLALKGIDVDPSEVADGRRGGGRSDSRRADSVVSADEDAGPFGTSLGDVLKAALKRKDGDA
jgi:small subunit ribosomal protein S1